LAKINDQDIEALREKADIVDLVSGYTTLKRSGGHSFKGLCPFHSEKTPSFQVDTAKGVFYCFGCSEGGNVYQFVQKIESLPFPEAVEWLARRENFELRYEEMSPGDRRSFGQKVRLVEANNEAARFFHKNLMEGPAAAAARRYLAGRGFGKEVAERWSLGFAPGRNLLTKHLMEKGFTQDELIAADLSRKSERDGSIYDTFRERITFPTWNLNNDVVAFGARAMGDQQPKYLNTSETPVFSKSRVMYGLNRAKSAIARGTAVIVVEGYTDVIALHEAGITEAVATNGVALGESHFEQLKKFTSRAVLMFDADDAGKGATERGFGMHHRIGLEVLVAPLPLGRDPADVVKDDGEEGVRKIIESGQSLLEFKLDQELSRVRLDTPEARSAAVRRCAEVLRLHPDPIARHEYAFMAAGRIGVDPEVVHRALSEARSGPSEATRGVTGGQDRRLPGHVKVEREALQLLLTFGSNHGPSLDSVEESHFTSAARREIFVSLRDTVGPTDVGELSQRLSPDARTLLSDLTVSDEDLPQEELPQRMHEVLTRLRVFSLERDIKGKRNTLQDVNPLDEPERHDTLFTELVGLEAERRDLLRRLQGES
jgi:DNA primase